MPTIFVTGATGYIGGDALQAVVEKHPDYSITALVRTKEKGELVVSRFPQIDLVYGDLDDSELLAAQVSKADIVCHWASCEHVGAAKAISEGLSRKPAGNPGFVIHLSGSDIVCGDDLRTGTYGEKREESYDDFDGLDKVLSLPSDSPHIQVDLTILEASKSGAKTAVVCPPCIYSLGRGPGNQRSIQLPELTSHILKRGQGYSVKEGKNIWSYIHVHDLSNLFLALVEAASQGGGQASWGPKGFYFAENGELSWGAATKEITEVAAEKGFLKTDALDSLSPEEADKVWEYSTVFLGTNSRVRATRARKLLGWSPSIRDYSEEITRLVSAEAEALNLSSKRVSVNQL